MRVLCLLAVLLLAGCGQKGPLYFAPDEPRQATPSTQATSLPSSPGHADEDGNDNQDDSD